MTLVKMLENNSIQYPQKTAVIFQGKKINYRELNEKVNCLANALLDMKHKKGDRIGFMLHRTPELVISFLAIAKVQGVAVPINFELPNNGIKHTLDSISPKLLIVHTSFLGVFSNTIYASSQIPVIEVGGTNNEGCFSWDEIEKNSKVGNPCLDIKDDDVVYLNYTSGSTGNPKGAITTHANIYWNTIASIKALGLEHEDVHLCMFAPFAHPHEMFARALYLGGTIVLVDKIYPKSIAESIDNHKVTCIMGLSPMYANLLELHDRGLYKFSSLRIPESGGMYTRLELVEEFRQKVGVPIIPVWGSTETTGIACANRPGESTDPGSVGKPCVSYEVKVVDEEGNELPPGEVGEMIFKGPAVVQGYFEDAANDNASFKDSWYYSSDLGRKDEKGNLYFVERKKGMMKVAGNKVYPLEIEQVINDHPEVNDVAVIKISDHLKGEVPMAIVVPKENHNLSRVEIRLFCKGKLANYKVPRKIEFVDELPKTDSGKVNKNVLMKEYQGEILQ